jgi:hypothetical protein
LLTLALAASAIALGSAPAWAEGGGTPPAEQGLSDPGAQRSQAMNSPGVYPNPGVAHQQQQQRVQNTNRGAYNGNRNTHNSRPQQYYGNNHRSYNHNNGYRDRSYAYVDPGYRGYYYAPPYYGAPYYGPPPVVYDPYPSPGISLFFNF